jgi:4-methyl-5(b-hydroxyethyl)-thiazole monophosphate biosynthesis
MEKNIRVPISDGCEEVEAACIIDVLRRADADVTVASVGNLQITASRGIKIIADRLISDCVNESFDLIVLPGGMPGAERLRDSKELTDLLTRQKQEGKLFAAICASPAIVLHHHGLLDDRKATAYPGMAEQLPNTESIESRVVVDGNCITSRGPGTAIEFSLKLVEVLYGEEMAKKIADAMLATY